MRKILYSLFAISALSSSLIAGGHISPVKKSVTPTPPAPVASPEDRGFYAGVAYSYINYDLTKTTNTNGNRTTATRDTEHNGVMFQAGYRHNRYLSFEGRYWLVADKSFMLGNLKRTKNLNAWGLYFKPTYPVAKAIDLYGLLGYAHIKTDFIAYRANGTTNVQKLDDNDFSWGAGLSYKINDTFQVFADFVRIYDDSQTKYLAAPLVGTKDWDMTIDSYNVGVSYRF